MALTVEDGTVVPNADSFLNLADARALATNCGLEISADDTTAEVQLRQAYLALVVYEPQLQGYRVSSEQTGIYPRTGVENSLFPFTKAGLSAANCGGVGGFGELNANNFGFLC